MFIIHVMGPAKERRIHRFEPLHSIIRDHLRRDVGPRFPAAEPIAFLNQVSEVERFVDSAESRIAELYSTGKQPGCDPHQRVLIILEGLEPQVIIKMGREKRVAMEGGG
jgi:hypothetical protein